MISYEPFWITMEKRGFTSYQLIYYWNISSNTLRRMRHNEAINSNTLNELCLILDCQVEDIMKFEASEEEMEEGRHNLSTHDNVVDFIVTHCCASSTQTLLGGSLYTPDGLTAYLEEIRQNVKFKRWFFGHYHDNRNVSAEEILLYEQMIRII